MFTVADSAEFNYGLCHDGSGPGPVVQVFMTGLAPGTLRQSHQNRPLAVWLHVSYLMAAVTGLLSNKATRAHHQETPSVSSELELASIAPGGYVRPRLQLFIRRLVSSR